MNNEAAIFAATAATLNLLPIVPNFILAHHEKNAELPRTAYFISGTGTVSWNSAVKTLPNEARQNERLNFSHSLPKPP